MAISLAEGLRKIWRKAALTCQRALAAASKLQSRSTFAAAKQATRLPYNGSSGNLLAYDYTTAISVFIALFLASVVPLVAQEHPRAPQQSQSQQLPQTTKGAPQAAMMQASMSRRF